MKLIVILILIKLQTYKIDKLERDKLQLAMYFVR